MKQISVSEKCSGCGLCVMNCSYLRENVDGNAEAVPGMAIKDSDMENVRRVVAECPEGALKIVDSGITNKTGSAGISEIINAFKKEVNSFSVKRVTGRDIKLDKSYYNLPVPCARGEYRSNYSSERAAKSAARDEFRSLCYSESAYRPMIKKVFVEYKLNALRPYYGTEDTEDSAYFVYNEKIRKLLSNVYAELENIAGPGMKLPESWKNFSVTLGKNDFAVEYLDRFDALSTSSGIIDDFKNNSSYTDLDDYIDYMDFDYDEEDDDDGGFFRRSRSRKMWYYSDFKSAASSFIDDLKSSISYMSSDIEESAADRVNTAVSEYEKRAKAELDKKVRELESYLR